MTDRSKPTEEKPRYVFFFTGPTACGKSTIAKYVADSMNFFFLEGDDVSAPRFHAYPPPPLPFSIHNTMKRDQYLSNSHSLSKGEKKREARAHNMEFSHKISSTPEPTWRKCTAANP